MGDRAVITTKDKEVGIYLHWNGDVTSVTAFLTWCKLRGLRAPDEDSYGWARLCQVIANYIEGCNYEMFQDLGESVIESFTGLSIGIDRYENMEGAADYDNGTYIIEGWDIVDREGPHIDDKCEELYSMLYEINSYQPKLMRLDESVFEPYKEID